MGLVVGQHSLEEIYEMLEALPVTLDQVDGLAEDLDQSLDAASALALGLVGHLGLEQQQLALRLRRLLW